MHLVNLTPQNTYSYQRVFFLSLAAALIFGVSEPFVVDLCSRVGIFKLTDYNLFQILILVDL